MASHLLNGLNRTAQRENVGAPASILVTAVLVGFAWLGTISTTALGADGATNDPDGDPAVATSMPFSPTNALPVHDISYDTLSSDADEPCATCDLPFLDAWSRTGWNFGAELLFLKLHDTTGVNNVNNLSNATLRWDYEPAVRAWLGYTLPNGLGIRFRGFSFDQGATGKAGILPLQSDLNAYVLDLDLYDVADLNEKWSTTFGGGLRYVDFAYSKGYTVPARPPFQPNPILYRNTYSSSTLGASLFGELRRHVTQRANLFISARGSWLFGDVAYTQQQGDYTSDPRVTQDSTLFLGELQLGGQWGRETKWGYFFTRAAFEAQQWHNFHGDVFSYSYVNHDLGLSGVAFSAGLLR